MNKIKTTKRSMKENYYIIGIGYCQAQALLNYRDPVAYSAGSNGWQCDYYDIDGVIISTGYDYINNKNTSYNYETLKEYEYFRIIGGDTVGMSTVPEVIVAHQMGIPCFAISVITDLGVPGKLKKVTVKDVEEAAARSAPKMTLIMEKLIENL